MAKHKTSVAVYLLMPQVLDGLAEGLMRKEIAYALNWSVGGLQNALQKERKRRGVKTSEQLVAEHIKEKLKHGR